MNTTNINITIGIKFILRPHPKFKISTCQHSASQPAFFFLSFCALRLWPPPWVLRRWHGVCHVPYWVRGHCHGHLKNSEKKGRLKDGCWKKHELQGKQKTPMKTLPKKRHTKKMPNIEKHDTGGIVKGSGTPSCFGFRWQVRVAQTGNSPLMGGQLFISMTKVFFLRVFFLVRMIPEFLDVWRPEVSLNLQAASYDVSTCNGEHVTSSTSSSRKKSGFERGSKLMTWGICQ